MSSPIAAAPDVTVTVAAAAAAAAPAPRTHCCRCSPLHTHTVAAAAHPSTHTYTVAAAAHPFTHTHIHHCCCCCSPTPKHTYELLLPLSTTPSNVCTRTHTPPTHAYTCTHTRITGVGTNINTINVRALTRTPVYTITELYMLLTLSHSSQSSCHMHCTHSWNCHS